MKKGLMVSLSLLAVLITCNSWAGDKPITELCRRDSVVTPLGIEQQGVAVQLVKNYGPCPRVPCHNDLDCRRAGGSKYCHCQVLIPKKGLHCGLYSGY